MDKEEFKRRLDIGCNQMELQADDIEHDYMIEAFYDMQIERYYTSSDENIGSFEDLKKCFKDFQKEYKRKKRILIKDLKF